MIRFRDKIASGLGSVLEWYDFALYGFFASVMAQLYFPSNTEQLALLKVFSVFAIGFLARPIGAIVFGYISDKYGRAHTLKLTPLLITLPTLGLAVLPTYDQIGLAATWILIILRFIQGVCIGGEYANNTVYLCEVAPVKQLFFYGSLASCTASLGILLASTIASILFDHLTTVNLLTWGWRAGFALALLLGTFTYFMRKNILETPAYARLALKQETEKHPIKTVISYQKSDTLLALGITYLPATAFYYVFMFLPNYLTHISGLNTSHILGNNALSLSIRLLCIPLLGLLADKIGGLKLAKTSTYLIITSTIPLLSMLTLTPIYLFTALFIFAMITALNAATTPGLLVQLLEIKTRGTTLAFTCNVAFGIFGGLTPVMCFSISNKTGSLLGTGYYLMFTAIITLIAASIFSKKRGTLNDFKSIYAYR